MAASSSSPRASRIRRACSTWISNWNKSTPAKAAHLVRGTLTGEGPWRVGDARLRVLGCHNTDPHLQDAFIAWQHYLQTQSGEYPPRQQIVELARRLGAAPSAAAS